jgi:hypothetical protein
VALFQVILMEQEIKQVHQQLLLANQEDCLFKDAFKVWFMHVNVVMRTVVFHHAIR